MTKDGGPAFPSDMESTGNLDNQNYGMSLRDWFAGQALSASDWSEWAGKEKFPAMGEKCYQLADAMIAQRGEAD